MPGTRSPRASSRPAATALPHLTPTQSTSSPARACRHSCRDAAPPRRRRRRRPGRPRGPSRRPPPATPSGATGTPARHSPRRPRRTRCPRPRSARTRAWLRAASRPRRRATDPAGPPGGTGRSRTCPSWSRRSARSPELSPRHSRGAAHPGRNVFRSAGRVGRQTDSRQPFVIGRRRSLPKPFAEIFVPGGYWRRLYSAVSTMRRVLTTSSRS